MISRVSNDARLCGPALFAIPFCAAVLLLAGCTPAVNGAPDAAATRSHTAATFSPQFVDVEGHTHQPFAIAETKALALVFVLPDCPIANSVIPELNRLHAEYADRGVTLLLVHADSEVTAEQAQEHAREYEVHCPVLLDPRHEWVERAEATTTPEAAVFTRNGELAYRGRINDLYAALGKRRSQPTQPDLKAALDAILAGKPVAVPRTEAVGCPIPELPTGD